MDDVQRLKRWVTAGGTWRVLARRPGSVAVALCRCDGGEEVDRIVSDDPATFDYLGERETSEEVQDRID